jgi:uncharacterized protein (DUF1919 family)
VKTLLNQTESEYLNLGSLDQELSWVLKIYSSGKINDLIYDGLLLFAHDEEIKAIREKWERKEINKVGLFHELEKLSKVESLPE